MPLSPADPAALVLADKTLRDECLVGPAGDAPWRMDAMPSTALRSCSRALRDLGVDVFEVGYPARSGRDYRVAQTLADEFRASGPVVSAVVPLFDGSLECIAEGGTAIGAAARPRLHLVAMHEAVTDADGYARPTDELVELTRAAVHRARHFTDDVEFSPLQGYGDLVPAIAAMAEAAIAEGADTINIRNCLTPNADAALYRETLERLLILAPSLADVTLSADPFSRGFRASAEALACAVAAIDVGARQIKCAMHGVGAASGHVRLEELSLRAAMGGLHGAEASTRLNHRRILETSATVAAAKGMPLDEFETFVGRALLDPSPRDFSGPLWERAEQARERSHLLRELGREVPAWLDQSPTSWPIDPMSGP